MRLGEAEISSTSALNFLPDLSSLTRQLTRTGDLGFDHGVTGHLRYLIKPHNWSQLSIAPP